MFFLGLAIGLVGGGTLGFVLSGILAAAKD
jgi:small-conductance mechanosensitive channel